MKARVVLRIMRQRLWGFTQADLALLLGVDKNTLARWERGERALPKSIVRHIDTLLDRDAERDKQAASYQVLWKMANS